MVFKGEGHRTVVAGKYNNELADGNYPEKLKIKCIGSRY